MARIDITPAGNDLYQVDVTDDAGTSTHEVTIPDGYLEKIGAGEVPHGDLVRESFRFLLEREPKEQIMGRFALPVIARYFPEYEDEIGARVASVTTEDREPPPPDGDPRADDAVQHPPGATGEQPLDDAVETEDRGPEALH